MAMNSEIGSMRRPAPQATLRESPFSLDAEERYQRWRDAKFDGYPTSTGELVVEIKDPTRLTQHERVGLMRRLRKTNMVIYRLRHGVGGKTTVRDLGTALGLRTLDANPYADEDRISAVSARPDAAAKGYIPYTNRALNWHTDGYYNPPERRIRAFSMHCIHPSAEGGENGLLDPEIAYIALRDHDPGLVRALMEPDAMTIPANVNEGETLRGEQGGPVFSVDSVTGALHMRYTARARSIRWKDSADVREAARILSALFTEPYIHRFRYKLTSGEGLICNNVLHSRSAYRDSPDHPRLLLRARYYERIANT
jgi:hypothetical protein